MAKHKKITIAEKQRKRKAFLRKTSSKGSSVILSLTDKKVSLIKSGSSSHKVSDKQSH